jgi:polyhydroxyalkanoate synthesis regulator phasin
MTTKATTFPGLNQVQESIRTLQSESEKLFARARREAGKLIGKDQRKALENLFDQVKAIRDDIQERTEKTLRTLWTGAEKILSQIESKAKMRLDPIVRRMSLPSKYEVELLAKRLSSLEKKVDELVNAKGTHAA